MAGRSDPAGGGGYGGDGLFRQRYKHCNLVLHSGRLRGMRRMMQVRLHIGQPQRARRGYTLTELAFVLLIAGPFSAAYGRRSDIHGEISVCSARHKK